MAKKRRNRKQGKDRRHLNQNEMQNKALAATHEIAPAIRDVLLSDLDNVTKAMLNRRLILQAFRRQVG